MFPYILAGCAVSSVVSALLCLVIGARLIKKYSRPLSLVAVGFLITLAVSHIIPEAMEEADPHKAGIIILVAILFLTFLWLVHSCFFKWCVWHFIWLSSSQLL